MWRLPPADYVPPPGPAPAVVKKPEPKPPAPDDAALAEADKEIKDVYKAEFAKKKPADQVELVKTMGLPEDYLEMFTTRVRSVDPDQIQAAARKYLTPEKATIVVVGDASVIAKPLEQFGKVEIEEAKY